MDVDKKDGQVNDLHVGLVKDNNVHGTPDPEHGAGPGEKGRGFDLVPVPLDGGYGWVIVAAVGTLSVISVCAFTTVGIFIVEFVEYFEASKLFVSLIGSLMMAALAVVGPVLPPVVKRLGCRPVGIIGTLGFSVSFIITSFAPGVITIIIFMGVFTGAFGSLFYICGQVMVHQYFDKKRALASSISAAGTAVAMFFWPPITRILIDKYSWRGASLILGGMCLNGLVAAALLKPPTMKKVTKPLKTAPKLSETKKAVSIIEEGNKCCSLLERRATHILMFFGWFFVLAGHNLVSIYIPLRADVFGVSKTKGAFLLSAFGITSGCVRLFAGWLGDRPWMRRNLLAGVAATYGGLLTAGSFPFRTFPTLLAFVILYAIGGGINSGVQSASVYDVFGIKHISEGFAALFMSMGISCLFAIPIGGYLYDVTGKPTATLVVFGLVQAFGGVCLSCIPFLQDYLRKRKTQREDNEVKA